MDHDLPSVARHRSTIVACLRDADTSIRRRALDLVYALTDRTNILQMAGEMVNYAVIAEPEERPTVCARVASAARRFAPSMRWEADTLLVLVAVRGESARKEVVRRLIYLVRQGGETAGRVVPRGDSAATRPATAAALPRHRSPQLPPPSRR